jgi:hypothetical protein
MSTSMEHDARGHGDATAEQASAAMRKTGVFVGVGAALLLGGWLVQPRFRTAKIEPESERVLFPELADAAKAASLSIVSYDDELATLKPFKVVQADGVWVLPSHDNYPADAKDQLAAAATELVDRPILDVVSTSPGDHETFGVIEPDPEKIQPGMTGVGRLVEIRDAAGNRLARLIVGKEDKRPGAGDASGGRPLRFVRKAGQDPVYRVELDTSKFTTKFDDWIEKDLLQLSPWDVRRVTIDDSTCTFGVDEASGRLRVAQDRKARIELAYDDSASTWSLVQLEGFGEDNKAREEKLADGEEIASAKLNDLRTALGDLKIVDVARKPAGLSGDLKAEESFTGDREAVMSLAQRGFFPFQSGEILSSNGETVVGMKDGVEYLLRFGNGTTVAADGAAEEASDTAGDEGKEDTTGRYLFVMARFNEDLLEKPVLEPLPEVPGVPGAEKADAPKPDAPKPDAPKPDAPKPDAPKADAPKADAPKADAPKADAPKADAPKPGPAQPAERADGEEKPTASDEDGAAADRNRASLLRSAEYRRQSRLTVIPVADTDEAVVEDKAVEPKAVEQPADAKPADVKPAAAALSDADEAEAKAQAALEERRRVERENRRKQEEYDGKVEAAKKRVRELNNRFADWYYVVSDEEYAKIRLDRAAVITKKTEEPAAAPN